MSVPPPVTFVSPAAPGEGLASVPYPMGTILREALPGIVFRRKMDSVQDEKDWVVWETSREEVVDNSTKEEQKADLAHQECIKGGIAEEIIPIMSY